MEKNNKSQVEKSASTSVSRLWERVTTAFLTILYNLDGIPEPIALAVNLLWASLAISLIQASLWGTAGSHFEYAFMMLIGSGLFAFLYLKIRSGRNWARRLLFISCIIDVLALGDELLNRDAPVATLLFGIVVPLKLYALYLLFTRPGSTWFRNVTPVN